MSLPPPGAIIEAHGLNNSPFLNGMRGTVIRHQQNGEALLPLVQFPDPHGVFMLKPSNLKVVELPKTSEPAAPSKERSIETKFPIQSEVEAVGLKTQSHLNGVRGRVETYKTSAEGSKRIVVDFGPPNGLIALRASNVINATPASGGQGAGSAPASKAGSVRGSLPPPTPTSPRSPSGSMVRMSTGMSRRSSIMSDRSSASRKSSGKTRVRRSETPVVQTVTGMVSYQDRYSTFASWPNHLQSAKVNPKELARSGFYHNPSQKDPDRCTCFTCGYSLVQWSPNDVPWSEHSKHVPTCAFVVAHKAILKASAAFSGKKRNRDLPTLIEEGYLSKQKPSALTKGWDDRYFALRGTNLYYYEEKSRVDLSKGCEARAIEGDSRSFTVNAVGQTRETFILKAHDEYDRIRWMEALNGSKEKGMSPEDIEILREFETAEAETRTQLVFDCAREIREIASAAMGNSMKLSSIIESEYREKVGRLEINNEQLSEIHRLHTQHQKELTNARLVTHLSKATRHDNKRVAYQLWRLAAAPNSNTNNQEKLIDFEVISRLQAQLVEATQRTDLTTEALKDTINDLRQSRREVASLQKELESLRTAPVPEELPPMGAEIFAHGLNNMAALNGQKGTVKEGQQLPDGTNVVLVEFGADKAPVLLKAKNIFQIPNQELCGMIRKETQDRLDDSLKRIAELERELQSNKDASQQSQDQQKPLHDQLTASANRQKELEDQLKQLQEQLQAAQESKSQQNSDLAPVQGLSQDKVVYSPVPVPGDRVIAHGLSMESINSHTGDVKEVRSLPDGTAVSVVQFPSSPNPVMLRRENMSIVPPKAILDIIIGDISRPYTDTIAQLKTQIAALEQKLAAQPKAAVDLPDNGDVVVAHGLRNLAELNGQDGKVVGQQAQPDGSTATIVQFESQTILLRPANYSKIPPPVVCAYINKPKDAEISTLKKNIQELESRLIVLQNQSQSSQDFTHEMPSKGSSVISYGLTSVDLNGLQGQVIDFQNLQDGSQAAVVKFNTRDTPILVKPQNIFKMPPKDICDYLTKEDRDARAQAEQMIADLREELRNKKTESIPSLPGVGCEVVTHDVKHDSELNAQKGEVAEHQTLQNGTVAAIVNVKGQMIMLKQEQVTPMPRQEVIDCILREEQAARQHAEAELEIERMNTASLMKRLDSQPDIASTTSLEDNAVVVPFDLEGMPHLLGQKGTILEHKRLADKTTVALVDFPETKTVMLKQHTFTSLPSKAYDAICDFAAKSSQDRIDQLEMEKTEAELRIQELEVTAANKEEAIAKKKDEEITALTAANEDLSKQLLDTQNTLNDLARQLADLKAQLEDRDAELAKALVSTKDIWNNPKEGDDVLVKGISGEIPQPGTVVRLDGNHAACIRLDTDNPESVGTVIKLSELVVLPPKDVCEVIRRELHINLTKSNTKITQQETYITELENKLMQQANDQQQSLLESEDRLRKMMSSKMTSSSCGFCNDLKEAVDDLLRKTEEERRVQKERQERMLAALTNQTRRRADEEAKLYEMIETLQKKAEERIRGSISREREENNRKMFPDTELLEVFEAMKRDAALKKRHFEEKERELLLQVDAAVRRGEDPRGLMTRIDELRAQTIEATRQQSEAESQLLKALRGRRENEEALVNDLRDYSLISKKGITDREQRLLEVVTVRDDQASELQEQIRQLRANIDTQTKTERQLIETIEAMRQQHGLDVQTPPTPIATPTPTSININDTPDIESLLDSVQDVRLRTILEAIRTENIQSQARRSDSFYAALESLQRKSDQLDQSDKVINGEIEELKKRVREGADSFTPTQVQVHVEREGSYQSPQRDWDSQAGSLELSQLRNQLTESKNNMASLQSELNQTAEALASSSARVHHLQTELDSQQRLVDSKQSDVSNLVFVIKKVLQLPMLHNQARKYLQEVVPLSEVEKVQWLFHHYDRDRNGRWSLEEAQAARGISRERWHQLCSTFGKDADNFGLTLSDVESMYQLEQPDVLHNDYEAARDHQILHINIPLDSEFSTRRQLQSLEEEVRETITSLMNDVIRLQKKFNVESPIRNVLNAVKQETETIRIEHAEHEVKFLAALRGDPIPEKKEHISSEVTEAIRGLSEQVNAQRGDLLEISRAVSPRRTIEMENLDLQKQIAILQVKVETLQDTIRGGSVASVHSHHSQLPTPTPNRTSTSLSLTTASVVLSKCSTRQTLHMKWLRWRCFVYKKTGGGQKRFLDTLQSMELAERDRIRDMQRENMEGQVFLMSALNELASNAPTLTLTGPIPIEVSEGASRHAIAAEEMGSRIELLKWKIDDNILHSQIAEVGGILKSLQLAVQGIHLPADIRARITRLSINYNSLGSMQKRMKELESKVDWLRNERDKAVVQASAADARLNEYRARIHKLRDEARNRGKSEQRAVPSPATLSPSPRHNYVTKWSQETSPPRGPIGWE
eukprot:TRINITY_DN6007_c0_g2_i3.p1 TRINITY_DN6007_c0_g2~~TRINITY_DN6007_c0_g2_i3.p1  ORF type:complete len:2434 (+),score=591.57 TRINITY_DN6007_c0_g2_i3:78-7379(+)